MLSGQSLREETVEVLVPLGANLVAMAKPVVKVVGSAHPMLARESPKRDGKCAVLA